MADETQHRDASIFCGRCGAPSTLSDDKFCRSCGAELSPSPPASPELTPWVEPASEPGALSIWVQLEAYDRETRSVDSIGKPELCAVFGEQETAALMAGAMAEQQKSAAMLREFAHGFCSEDTEWGSPLAHSFEAPFRLWSMIELAKSNGTHANVEDSLQLVGGYQSLDDARSALQSILE